MARVNKKGEPYAARKSSEAYKQGVLMASEQIKNLQTHAPSLFAETSFKKGAINALRKRGGAKGRQGLGWASAYCARHAHRKLVNRKDVQCALDVGSIMRHNKAYKGKTVVHAKRKARKGDQLTKKQKLALAAGRLKRTIIPKLGITGTAAGVKKGKYLAKLIAKGDTRRFLSKNFKKYDRFQGGLVI